MPGIHSSVPPANVDEERDKPTFDEQTLAKLLEAAYVLQQQNRSLKKLELNLELQRDQVQAQQESSLAPPSTPQAQASQTQASKDDYTPTLAQIVDLQHQIHSRRMGSDDAIALVAERVTQIANAGGAAIGMVEGKKVRYVAVSGSMAPALDAEVALEKALCVASLRTGQVIRCSNINAEFLVDVEECQRREIQSMIAVPIYYEGGVAGGLELYYSSIQAFTEQDVHTCQLMAGLVTEALVRSKEMSLKRSLADERAVMLAALEKLKPNLAALSNGNAQSTSQRSAPAGSANGNADVTHCGKCGHTLIGAEQFCGKCGTPRNGEYDPSTTQTKLAAVWQMQAGNEISAAIEEEGNGWKPDAKEPAASLLPEKPLADSIEEEMPELFAEPSQQPSKLDDFIAPVAGTETPEISAQIATAPQEDEDKEEVVEDEVKENALVKATPTWSSAVAARAYLEESAPKEPASTLAALWNSRRGDIYLGLAVLLVAIVIRWGIWSSSPVGATGGNNVATTHGKASPDADLSAFDRMLISLGLAEAPPPVENKGNPDTRVWVDLHTALYYCPSNDLYGKTPKGKYETQREAQLDQFEPAYRKTCQ